MMEEIRNFEDRERLQKETHRKIVEVYQQKLERERHETDTLRAENHEL